MEQHQDLASVQKASKKAISRISFKINWLKQNLEVIIKWLEDCGLLTKLKVPPEEVVPEPHYKLRL